MKKTGRNAGFLFISFDHSSHLLKDPDANQLIQSSLNTATRIC